MQIFLLRGDHKLPVMLPIVPFPPSSVLGIPLLEGQKSAAQHRGWGRVMGRQAVMCSSEAQSRVPCSCVHAEGSRVTAVHLLSHVSAEIHSDFYEAG